MLLGQLGPQLREVVVCDCYLESVACVGQLAAWLQGWPGTVTVRIARMDITASGQESLPIVMAALASAEARAALAGVQSLELAVGAVAVTMPLPNN